jgi:geranylgeranyl pyrophosphate synthase
LLGVDAARDRAKRYAEEARDAVESFGEKAVVLKQLAGLVIDRES